CRPRARARTADWRWRSAWRPARRRRRRGSALGMVSFSSTPPCRAPRPALSGGGGEAARHLRADRQRGGETRALDAEEGDEAGEAVRFRSIDAEIRLRLAGAVQLGADAGVVGAQRAVRQTRPEVADVFVEARGPGGIDAVVLGLDEREVGPEHGLAAEVLAVVGAERAGDRRRVDQVLERRAPGQ